LDNIKPRWVKLQKGGGRKGWGCGKETLWKGKNKKSELTPKSHTGAVKLKLYKTGRGDEIGGGGNFGAWL